MSLEEDIFNSMLLHTATVERDVFGVAYNHGSMYWPLDHGGQDEAPAGLWPLDVPSSNTHRPTFSTDSVVNGGMYFDGVDDVFETSGTGLGDSAAVAKTAAFLTGTVGFWFKLDPLSSLDPYYTLYAERAGSPTAGTFRGFKIEAMHGGGVVNIVLSASDSAGTVLLAATGAAEELDPALWHSVFVVNQGATSPRLKLYLDGVLSATTFNYSWGTTFAATKLSFGGDANEAATFFRGWIDEAFVRNDSALAEATIQQIIDGTPTRDTYGRPTAVGTRKVREIACHFSDHRMPGAISSSRENVIFQAEVLRSNPICIFPYDVDVVESDRVVDETTGAKYEVEGVENAAGQGQHKRVFLKRFSGGS
jgi:hypothetical protein